MSKPTFVLFLFLICCLPPTIAQKYNDYFTDNACRVDFYLTGNTHNTNVFLSRICKEPIWGGRRQHIETDANLGEYRFRVLDSLTQKLIYTDGFSALFYEWQSTPEASLINKGFEQTIQFPFPLKTVKLIIEKRIDFSNWESLANFYISPNDQLIRHTKASAEVKNIVRNFDPAHAIDIAVIAEGYTTRQKAKFLKDAQKLAESLLNHEPFKTYKSKINIYAIVTASADTGVSAPQKSIWQNSALGAHYHTFYSERYLTTPNVFTLRDYASLVPYDAIYILANTKIYGGGGIFNFYTLASADSQKAQSEVVVHEFGHSFAGLADEYFYDSDALDEMYDLKIEPWEPNITTLVNFEAKWKNSLTVSTLIPTPVTDDSKAKIGVFEGGGYRKKGVYRPSFDCRMRTNTAKRFCPVCEKAIIQRIKFLTE